MPTIRKRTAGTEFVHNHGQVSGGDTVDVPRDTAEFLIGTGEYEHVNDGSEQEATDGAESDPNTDEGDSTPDGDAVALPKLDGPTVDTLKEGVCPWCEGDDGYEGDHVGQHASSAHADKWDAYKEAL